MGYSSRTFGSFLYEEQDVSKVLEIIYRLDTRMKDIHSKGYYVQNIGFNSIIVNDNDDYGFSYIDKLPSENSELYIQSNINSFARLSLGAFVFISMDGPKMLMDYNQVSNQNPNFIEEHYDIIRSLIPYSNQYADYYDMVLSGNYGYFSDFVDSKNKQGQSNSNNSRAMVKATSVGRALSGDDNDAFIRVMYYPILGLCISVLSIIVYLLILRN